MNEITEAQAAEVQTRDRLVQMALLGGVDEVAMDVRLRHAPGAVATRAVVSAAVGYLLAVGAIKATPPDEMDEWLPVGIPEHLTPDIDSLTAGNRALRDVFLPPSTSHPR